jgi:hypothetical protein
MRATVFLALLFLTAFPLDAKDNQLLGTAKSANLLTDVEWNKHRQFNSDLELRRMSRAVSGTQLWKHFRMATAGADIIMKLHEDATIIDSETITLTVYDPDDNGLIYSEERPLIDLDNDITRLISHFLAKVEEARKPFKEAQEAAARQRQDDEELRHAIAADEAAEAQRLKKLKSGTVTVRPGGMKVHFNAGVNLEVREELLKVLDDAVDEDSLKDPNFVMEFWSEDGTFITYELIYKGLVTKSCTKTVLSPMQFKDEILKNW